MSQILPHIQGYSEQRIALKIEDVLDEVSRITHITSARPLSIKTHCEDDLWLVEGDRVQLTQTFLIFCLNARDAIGHGEGDLTLSAANTVIGPGHPLADQAPAPGNYVTVQVNDTGCGMTPDVLARIYEPFFTTKLPKKGTGLGLPAAREILHSHGGFLQVSSQAGQGTQITAGLPAVKYAPQKNLKKNSGQTRQPG